MRGGGMRLAKEIANVRMGPKHFFDNNSAFITVACEQ